MCFDHSDSVHVAHVNYIRHARKRHQCDECFGHIEPGESYRRSRGYDGGDAHTWRICEGCDYLAALLYAQEISEGCGPWESQPPVGGGFLRESIHDRGWTMPTPWKAGAS